MSSVVQNPITHGDTDLNLFSDDKASGEVVTPSVYSPSESMVRKCLHPPSAMPGFDGLPTNDARTQVLLQYTDVGINGSPLIRNADSDAITPSPDMLSRFDYAYLLPNGLNVNAIGFIYNKLTGSVEQDYAGVIKNQAYAVEDFHDDAQLYRPVYKSSTFMLNATAFNDTGLVTVNQFNPNILFAGNFYAMAAENSSMFYDLMEQEHQKNAKAGFKLHYGPRDPEWPRLSAAYRKLPMYVLDEMRRRLEIPHDSLPTVDPSSTIQIVGLGQLGSASGANPDWVPTPTQIMNQSTRSYTGKAKDGAFIVQRLNTVAPSWLTANNMWGETATPWGMYLCYAMLKSADGGVHYIPFTDNVTPGTQLSTAPKLLDTLWSKDMTWSWVYFQGLSLQATGPQAAPTTSLISRKIYTGYEVQPSPKSAWAGLMRAAPEPNIGAMQAMMDGFYRLKDGMPACYNFWGTIGTLLGPSLLKAGGSILKWLTGKVDEASQPRAAPVPAGDAQVRAARRVARTAEPRPSRSRSTRPRNTNRAPTRERERLRQDENRIAHLERTLANLSIRSNAVPRTMVFNRSASAPPATGRRVRNRQVVAQRPARR